MTAAYVLFTAVLGISLFRLYSNAMQFTADYTQQEDMSFREFFDTLKISNEVLSTARRERIKRACDPRSVPVNLILSIDSKNPTPLPDLPFEDPTLLRRTVVQIEGDNESVEKELQTYIDSILAEEYVWEEAGSDESVFFSLARTFEEEDELEEWELMFAPTEPVWELEGGLS